MNTGELPLLTFKQLDALIENELIESSEDREIAEKIVEAETDWIIAVHSLNDFLVILEKEIDGSTTRKNLEDLMKHYSHNPSKYTWESESVSKLLEILTFAEEDNLRTLFFKFEKRIENRT